MCYLPQGGDGVLESLQQTSRNIGMLRLAQLRLKDNIRDKNAALTTDSSIVRLRRRKGDHHWINGTAF